MLKQALFSVLLAASAASAVNAHGVWAGMRADKLQIVYGEGPLDNYYNPTWFDYAKGYNKNGQEASVNVIKKDGKLFLAPNADVQIIAINSENGYWSNTKSGAWINKAKDENPEATKGKQHHKMSVNYISQNIVLKGDKPIKIETPKALGLDMEIVPSVDPRFLNVGDTLTIQVFYQGKPMKNIDVMPDAINQLGKTVQTDENGKATITVANNGVNMIAVETAFPRKNTSKADTDGYFTSLNFTLFNE